MELKHLFDIRGKKLLNIYRKKSELLTSINRPPSGIQLLTAVDKISFSNRTLQFSSATWHPLAVETLLLRSCTFNYFALVFTSLVLSMIKNWIRLLKLSLIVPNQSHLGPQRVMNLDPLDQFTALDKLEFFRHLEMYKKLLQNFQTSSGQDQPLVPSSQCPR